MVTIVAKIYKLDIGYILESKKGLRVENKPRKIAMYLSQQLTGESQKEIAQLFNLKSTGSVSYTTHKIRVKIKEDKKFAREIKSIIEKVIRKVV